MEEGTHADLIARGRTVLGAAPAAAAGGGAGGGGGEWAVSCSGARCQGGHCTPAWRRSGRLSSSGVRCLPLGSGARRSPDWGRLAREIARRRPTGSGATPASYAKYLEAMAPQLRRARCMERPGRAHLRTEEGGAGGRAKPSRRSRGATPHAAAAAGRRDWPGAAGGSCEAIRDPSAALEHRGTDGSDPAARAMERSRPAGVGAVAENIGDVTV